ncbi:MAG TPA: hypothetical protein VFE47_19255 [Tepidisphaeraceae bacterium]|jgi:hypothetical protein|nr:hypothetical protein [Tepidisphaeraceae bacterium]
MSPATSQATLNIIICTTNRWPFAMARRYDVVVRRHFRRLFVTLSLVAGIAALWLLARSYGAYDEFDGCRGHIYLGMVSAEGEIYLTIYSHVPESMALRHAYQPVNPDGFGPTFFENHPPCIGLQPQLVPTRHGFGVLSGVDEPCLGESMMGFQSPFVIVAFPHWLLAALASLLPLRSLLRLVRRRSRLCRGLCVPCGFDLRCSLVRCPECGAKEQTK